LLGPLLKAALELRREGVERKIRRRRGCWGPAAAIAPSWQREGPKVSVLLAAPSLITIPPDTPMVSVDRPSRDTIPLSHGEPIIRLLLPKIRKQDDPGCKGLRRYEGRRHRIQRRRLLVLGGVQSRDSRLANLKDKNTAKIRLRLILFQMNKCAFIDKAVLGFSTKIKYVFLHNNTLTMILNCNKYSSVLQLA
jgi:hypothetical protein